MHAGVLGALPVVPRAGTKGHTRTKGCARTISHNGMVFHARDYGTAARTPPHPAHAKSGVGRLSQLRFPTSCPPCPGDEREARTMLSFSTALWPLFWTVVGGAVITIALCWLTAVARGPRRAA